MTARPVVSLLAPLLMGAFLLAPSLPARAQDGPVSAKEAFEHLTKLNGELRAAWDLLPKSYGADPVKEAAAINEAQEAVTGIVRQIQGKHKSAEEAFKALQANVAQFNAQLDIARLAQKASAANAVIVDKHASEKAASDAELHLLDDAVKALAAKGGESWVPVTSWFQAQQKEHAKRKQALLELAAQRAQDAADAQKQAALDAAMKKANAAMAYVATALGDEGPVSEAIFRELQIAANKVASLDAGASRFWMQRLQTMKLASALKEKRKSNQGELSAVALEGGLLSSGRVRSRTLKVRFRADANWCYALAMRHVGGERVTVSPVDFSFKSRGGHLQTFSIPQEVPGFQQMVGTCTDGKGRVTARADVDLKGGSLRWVVVGWPRADVPKGLFSQAQVLRSDPCDFEAWTSQWKAPVPGTVVYYRGRAHLVRAAGPVGDDKLTLINVAGQDVQAMKSEVTGKPSGAPSAAPAYAFNGCPDKETATADRSKAINRCYEKTERKYKRSLGKLQRWVDKARSDARREKAEAKLAAKLEKKKAEEVENCEPLKAKAAEDGQAAYRDVVEFTDSGAVAGGLDRAAMLQALERAKPSI